MRCFAVVWILVTSLLSQIVCAQTLSAKIDSIIEQQLPHATVGIVVKDLKTDQVIYSRNATKLLSPASAMKLFTATAAVYQLNPNYRFLTTLSQKGQDFYLTFSGAPDFTIDNLKALLSNLKKSGVKVIRGNIILDISRFKSPYYPGGISYDDLGWYYSAPETAVILNENAVAYDFVSAKKIGMPIQIKPKTSENELTIVNQVITVNKEQEKDHCALNVEVQPHNTLRLFGCLAKTEEPFTMQLAVPEPVLLAKQKINEALKKDGIVLKGQIIIGQTPSDAQSIGILQSSDLAQLITHMLQNSDNLYANSIARTLAYSVTGEGSSKQSAFAIRKILSQHTNLDMTQLEIADGMGTRYNLTSPQQIVTLLTDLYRDKKMQTIFLKALPQSGVSGSLQNRMKETNLDKIVFAKTGTMHDISSLSGYLLKQNANPLVFSIIINGVNTPISTAKSLEEQILGIVNGKLQETHHLESDTNKVVMDQS